MKIFEKIRNALGRLLDRRVIRRPHYCQWATRSDAHYMCGYFQVCEGCEDHIAARERKAANEQK